jgi:hypothetical protein
MRSGPPSKSGCLSVIVLVVGLGLIAFSVVGLMALRAS